MVYGTYNYSIHGVYKQSYNWGAPHCTNHGPFGGSPSPRGTKKAGSKNDSTRHGNWLSTKQEKRHLQTQEETVPQKTNMFGDSNHSAGVRATAHFGRFRRRRVLHTPVFNMFLLSVTLSSMMPICLQIWVHVQSQISTWKLHFLPNHVLLHCALIFFVHVV